MDWFQKGLIQEIEEIHWRQMEIQRATTAFAFSWTNSISTSLHISHPQTFPVNMPASLLVAFFFFFSSFANRPPELHLHFYSVMHHFFLQASRCSVIRIRCISDSQKVKCFRQIRGVPLSSPPHFFVLCLPGLVM